MSEPVCLFRRDNGFYYIRVRMKDGRDRWKSTGERTKTAALAAIKKGLKFKEKRELEPAPEPVKHDFGQLTARVLEYVQANYAQNTWDIYRLALDAFRRIIGDVPLDSVTAADADRFKITRLAEMAPASVNLQLRTLRAAFGHAKRWRMIEHNPFTGVALVRVPDKAPSFLTVEQFGELINRITDHWLRDLVMFAASTGMRQGEIRHLEWQHVDMDRRIVHVTSTATFKTKMGKRRVVPLNEKAMDVVRRQPRTGQFVFTMDRRQIRRDTLTHAFKKQVKALGLSNDIHFHSLRHTFASWLVQDGVSLYQVGRLLGHSDTKTTEIYAHLQPETMHDVVDRIKL